MALSGTRSHGILHCHVLPVKNKVKKWKALLKNALYEAVEMTDFIKS